MKILTPGYIHPNGCGIPDCPICLERDGYLYVNPHCKMCGGAGFVHPSLLDGRTDGRKSVACEGVGCYAENWGKLIAKKDKQEMRLDNFEIDGRRAKYPIVKKALIYSASYLKYWDKGEGEKCPPILVFVGSVGTGKTHLATGISKLLRGSHYWNVDQLIEQLGKEIGNNTSSAFIEMLEDCQCLILDDFKREQSTQTPGRMAKIEALIQYRYGGLLPTIVTTNENLDKLPPRIADRLGDKEFAKVFMLTQENGKPIPSYRGYKRK